MPRYFFHVHDGTNMPDEEGVELPDLKAARSQGILACGEMLKDIDGDLPRDLVWEMVVEDEAGAPVLTFRFTAIEHRPLD